MVRLVSLFIILGSLGAWADEYLTALDKLKAGDQLGAIEILQSEVAKNPASVESNVLLTETLLGMQRVEEANKVADAALARNPQGSEFHRIAGDARFRGGNIFGADVEYKAALKLDAKNARAQLGQARAYQTGSLNRTGELLIYQAHNLDPEDPIIEEALEQIESDKPETIGRWEKVLPKLSEEDPSAGISLRAHIARAKKLAGKPERELASPYGHYQIPIHALMDGQRFAGIGVTISIGGAKGDLQLDTGASGFIISRRMAERAGVERLADVELHGIGNKGPARGWIGYAEQISIGDVQFRNCIVEVSDGGPVGEGNGLIGTDIVQRFLVTLNFAAHRIELDPLPGPAWDGKKMVDRYNGPELRDYAQFLRRHHDILIPTRISDGPPVLFLLDTGSGVSMISTNVAGSITKLRNNSQMRVKGISGEVKMMYSADKVTLEFATFRQLNQDLTAFDLSRVSRAAGTEVTGIMGMPLLGLFSSITLDYRDGRVKFEYKR